MALSNLTAPTKKSKAPFGPSDPGTIGIAMPPDQRVGVEPWFPSPTQGKAPSGPSDPGTIGIAMPPKDAYGGFVPRMPGEGFGPPPPPVGRAPRPGEGFGEREVHTSIPTTPENRTGEPTFPPTQSTPPNMNISHGGPGSIPSQPAPSPAPSYPTLSSPFTGASPPSPSPGSSFVTDPAGQAYVGKLGDQPVTSVDDLGGGAFQVRSTPTLNAQDVIQAAMRDREEQARMASGQKAAWERGLGVLEDQQRGLMGSSVLGGARDSYASMMGLPEQFMNQGLGDIDKTRGQVGELGDTIRGFRDEALAEQETREAATMAEFRDTTAEKLQLQRQVYDDQYNQNLAELQQQNPDRTSPEYQESKRRLDGQRNQQMGNVAAQYAVHYNETRLQANMANNAARSSLRKSMDLAAIQTDITMNQLGMQLDQMGINIRDSRLANERSINSAYAQIEIATQQLQQIGAGDIATQLMNYVDYYLPISDLVAAAALSQASTAAGIGLPDISIGNTQSSSSVGTQSRRSPARRPSGSSGSRSRDVGRSLTPDSPVPADAPSRRM